MNFHFTQPPLVADHKTKPPVALALCGWVCDRYSDGGMRGAALLARAAAARLNAPLRELGAPEPPMDIEWRACLAKAMPYLREVAASIDAVMRDGLRPMIFANRCGASLATIAAALRRWPDMKVVWCDAHGDFNTPETTRTGYLGGMVLPALCGLWRSGLGDGLSPDRLVIVGARDLDKAEADLIKRCKIRLIPPQDDGAIDAGRVIEAVGGAPIWLHIDADVIDPIYIPAEYKIERGLKPAAMRDLIRGLVRSSELVGFEATEFEAPLDPQQCDAAVGLIMTMIEPALAAACATERK